jgi:cyclophilin family peptidyl-prolyl cis-trans isomerase
MTRSVHRLLVVLAVLATTLAPAACSMAATAPTLPTFPPEASAAPTPAPTHPGPTYQPGCPTSQPEALPKTETRTVTIKTDKGSIVIKVDGALSPIAAGNFVKLVSCGYYDGVVFHRAVPGFVLQGGDGMFGRSPDVITSLVGSGGPPYTIKDEPVTTTYTRGTVALARREDTPDSAASQFFIVLADDAAARLTAAGANNYQIFGHVVTGMDVVDAIVGQPNGGAPAFQPTSPVVMTSVTATAP